jgi:Domain of unknown function (DUF4145)
MTLILAHCNSCGGERNHEVLHSVGTSLENAEPNCIYYETYRTLKCCGCSDIKLQHYSFVDDDDEGATVQYFPPAIFRRMPAWFSGIRQYLKSDELFVETLLSEIYVAHQHNLPSLVTMGIRALLEKIMISKVGDKGSFSKNIGEFEKLGHISTAQRDRLDTILDAGHATMHRAFTPQLDDVVICLEITEHIIESVFLHELKVKHLRATIPQRKDHA